MPQLLPEISFLTARCSRDARSSLPAPAADLDGRWRSSARAPAPPSSCRAATRPSWTRVYDEIEALGAPQPAIAVLDLALATAVEYDALAHTIGTEFGKLDGLVHAAALLGDRSPLEQYDVPTWCKVLHVNLTAPFISDAGLAAGFTQIRRRLDHLCQQRRGEAIAAVLGRLRGVEGRTGVRARHAVRGIGRRGRTSASTA